MAIERLIHYVNSLHTISKDLNLRLTEATPQQKRFNKHINIVLPEMHYQEGLFVLNGIIKAFRLNEEGEEKIYCFWKEDEFVVLEDCLFYNQCSDLYLSPIETSDVLVVKKGDMEKFNAEFPETRRHTELILKQQNIKREKLLGIICNPPKDRYELFQQSFPSLWHRLSDKDVCSYLCISAKTLSRSKSSPKRL